jgi:RNA polymerase sigma-70 factor (ECF subfamily)
VIDDDGPEPVMPHRGPTTQSTVEHAKTNPSSSSDERLLARFVKGDDDAFGTLAQRHEPALLGLARAMLAGRDDLARDAVQDSWMRAIRHAHGFDGRNGASVRTWLYRIVVNRCHDVRAKAMRAGALMAEERASRDAQTWTTPGDESADDEWRRGLRGELERLPEGSRVVLLLCYHHELTHPQVAEILDLPLGTVKSRLNAALNTLRERIGEERHS